MQLKISLLSVIIPVKQVRRKAEYYPAYYMAIYYNCIKQAYQLTIFHLPSNANAEQRSAIEK